MEIFLNASLLFFIIRLFMGELSDSFAAGLVRNSFRVSLNDRLSFLSSFFGVLIEMLLSIGLEIDLLRARGSVRSKACTWGESSVDWWFPLMISGRCFLNSSMVLFFLLMLFRCLIIILAG